MTNERIGKLIGLTHSAVSRIRRGERLPSLKVMVAIGVQFRWPVMEQIEARTRPGEYAEQFNLAIERHPEIT